MAERKPTPDGDATPMPGTLRTVPDPVSLDAIEVAGAVRFGQAVRRATLELADGRTVSVELPTRGSEESADATGERIMATLRKAGGPLTRKEVALRMNLTSTRGRFGEAFRLLVEEGKILRHGDVYTDTPLKIKQQ